MPIVVKDFTWSQTESTLAITVPLRGVHQSKVDIFYSVRYIKANYDPYFFEVLLLHPVIIKQCKCTLSSDSMVYELVKDDKMIWETLEPTLTRIEKNELKMKLIEEEHERFQEECQANRNKKSELKRLAVQEQMKIDTEVREQIEAIKNKEKVQALGDLKEWQEDLTDNCKQKKIRKKKRKMKNYSQPLILEEPPELEQNIPVPLPRSPQQLEIEFTPRQFPTPIRESKLEEENEWLKQQAQARRTIGFVSEDIRPEERNPQFLLGKGDEFMKMNNYLGAISAYSFGIKLSDKFVDLYIGRSVAHLAVGNYNKAAVDCSTALDLMKPAVEANLKQRALCVGRRGMALCKLGLLSKGIDEIEASLKLSHNEEFKEFLKQAEIEWMNKSDSD